MIYQPIMYTEVDYTGLKYGRYDIILLRACSFNMLYGSDD